MAADIEAILRNLLASYDFADKTLVAIGAGGGQFAGYGSVARRVIAVDSDAAAIAQLAARVAELGLTEKFELVTGDFFAELHRGDVVLFEFCLHEMPDPEKAIARAREMAADVVIIDHYPGSPWAFQVVEEEKVARCWEAIRGRRPRMVKSFEALQRFARYDDLLARVATQGEVAVERARPFADARDITIRASYAVVLL
ncbi:MAG: hypothetical protein PVJ73_16355 [Acidobacteriota bacterium]|jgi:hypothetical protein